MSLSAHNPGDHPSTVKWSLQGAVVIVTGGNKGIGLEVTRQLMAKGAHVIMACRDMPACEAAAEKLRLASKEAKGTGTCSCAQLDLENLDSVREFAAAQSKALTTSKQRLAVLVNNAGVMGVPNAPDGSDGHIKINHLGPFLLTRLLAPHMSHGGRVVNVASRAHYWGRLDFDSQGNLTSQPSNWFFQYSRSKLANVVFTAEMQRRASQAGQQLTAVSVSPGFVSSGIFTSLPWPLPFLAQPLVSLVGRSTAKGAETVVYAASSPDLTGGPQELFLHDCRPLEPSRAARDERNGRLLWEWSSRMTGLDP